MFKFVATALPDLPVAENTINEIIKDEAALSIVPLPFESLQYKTKPQWYKTLVEADAILVRSGIVDRFLIDELKNCKVISLHGVGVDQVDVDYCYQKGIVVTNVPGGNANAAAELTVALMLDSLRNVSYADRCMKDNNWDAGRAIGNELGSQKVGIIGLGNIGLKVAKLCSAFGAEVKYYDIKKHSSEMGFERLGLKELLNYATIASIHIPLNENTNSIIGYKELCLLGDKGILINVARGAIVDEKALIRVLKEKKLKWLACDVFSSEPPDFKSELFSFRNTTFTPHVGGSTVECLETIARRATIDMLRVCKEQVPLYVVNV